MSAKFCLTWAILALSIGLQSAMASPQIQSCYEELYLSPPQRRGPQQALHIFVDQTMPISSEMKKSVMDLVSDWGKDGDLVRIARYSAFTRNQYTELMFDEWVDPNPDQEYLYHLRDQDRDQLVMCLEEQRQAFHLLFRNALRKTLDMTDPKLPKTDMFYSLHELASKVLLNNAEVEQAVLIVSDGLENSDYGSFHRRPAVVRKIEPEKELSRIKANKLIPDWRQARIYFYGLGKVKSERFYVRPKLVDPLKTFWKNYFDSGGARVVHLGSPEILVSSIRTD